jgi:3,4-dihydroxy-2-butanone 4-phosphate synthase
VHRKAGGEEIAGKIQERAGILAALADNPLTRSWRASMDRFVTGPIGRRMASDETLEFGVPSLVSKMPLQDGVPAPVVVNAVNRYSGEDMTANDMIEVAQDFIDNGVSTDAPEMLGFAMLGATDQGLIDRAGQMEIAAQMARAHGGRYGLTETGTNLRNYVTGSPVAAYAAVGGSTALLVKGAMDVAGRMQAGEPVSEEEAAAATEVLRGAARG